MNKDIFNMRKTMATIVFMYILTFIVGMFLVIVVGLPILRIIKPDVTIALPLLLAVSANQFILKYRNCFTSYFSCTNRIIYMNAFVFSALLCLLLSFLFMGILHYGVWGLVGAQIISQAVYNLWYWPCKANRELDLTFCGTFQIGSSVILRKFNNLRNRQ